MRSMPHRLVVTGAALLLAGLTTVPAAGASPSATAVAPNAAAGTEFAFSHGAFATAVTGNAAVRSGPTAKTSLCTANAGVRRANDVAGVDVPAVLQVEGAETRTRTFQRKRTEIESSATIAEVSLLGGQIHAEGLTSTVRSWHNAKGYHSAIESSIAGLTVLGEQVQIDPAGNQTIELAGVGTLTINDRRTVERARFAAGTTNVLKLKLADGTLVRVGHVGNRIDGGATAGTFFGEGWGSKVTVGGTVKSGRTAVQPFPCVGTRNKVRENTTAGAGVPNLVGIDGVRSWVQAAQGPTPRANANSRIASVSLLGGLATIEGVEAHVQIRATPDGDIQKTYTGTKIANIVVAGVEIDVPTRPGQQIGLPGVGTLTFQRVSETARAGTVTAVTIELLDGAVIELGHARAGLRT